jgi:hypothetical protein
MSIRIPISAQASTLRAVADKASPHSLMRAGLASCISEGELIIARLKAGADTLALVERHIEEINCVLAVAK